MTLTNAKKQSRYCERHLSVDGEKVRVLRVRKWSVSHATGYTITALVEELIERAERPVTARLPSGSLEAE
jgi:hypothetical protein